MKLTFLTFLILTAFLNPDHAAAFGSGSSETAELKEEKADLREDRSSLRRKIARAKDPAHKRALEERLRSIENQIEEVDDELKEARREERKSARDPNLAGGSQGGGRGAMLGTAVGMLGQFAQMYMQNQQVKYVSNQNAVMGFPSSANPPWMVGYGQNMNYGMNYGAMSTWNGGIYPNQVPFGNTLSQPSNPLLYQTTPSVFSGAR